MLPLTFILAFALASFLHAVLQAWAPSNLLIRRVKAVPPRWRTAAGLILLAYALSLVVRVLEIAIADGAPTWLYFAVGILSWDAIKVVSLAVWVLVRRLAVPGHHVGDSRLSDVRQSGVRIPVSVSLLK